MRYSWLLLQRAIRAALVVAAFSSCYAKPGEDSAEESQDDLQGEEGTEGNLPVVECSTTSFPRTGDPCSAADLEAGIRCRQCGCGLSCCDSCDCEEDLRWSCGILCEDTYLDGGSERCYLGTPPRCLQTCVPLPESADDGGEEENGPTADIPDGSHDLPVEERMDVEGEDVAGGCEQVLPSITSAAPEWCADDYPGSCLTRPCGGCQVCYVDITAGPIDNADAPVYGCEGDGQCHDLCAGDSDCGADEECVNLAWWNGHDVLSACLKMCWTRADPAPYRCP